MTRKEAPCGGQFPAKGGLQYDKLITIRLYRLGTRESEEEQSEGQHLRTEVLHKLGLGSERHFYQLSDVQRHLRESWHRK